MKEKRPPDHCDRGFYKVVKTSLSILKNPEVNLEKIDDAVIRTHIITHSLQFLKLFLLHRYETGIFPVIDKTLIRCVMKTVSVSSLKDKISKDKKTDGGTKNLHQ